MKLTGKLSRIKYAREAGQVKRCHTVPVIGHYDVAQHTFNMLCMLRVLYPEPTLRLIWAIIAHDVPERTTGDIPATSKWSGIVNTQTLKDAEDHILSDVGFDHLSLNQEEQKILKGLDMLELFFWTLDQRELGNKNASVMECRILKWVNEHEDCISKDILWLFSYSQENWKFLEELGDL